MPRPSELKGKVAVVTGASRGVGRGVAQGLGEAGMVVYVTGRTAREGDAPLPGSLESTAREVTALGGEGIPVRCDHTRDDDVDALFARVLEERGQIDVLVNSAWGGYERMSEEGEFTWPKPFWEQPRWRWEAMFRSGVRAAYVASQAAAAAMVRRGSGLIVHISFWAAQKYVANVAYGASKAATDKLAADMAHELRSHGVTVVSLYPGLVRTEGVLRDAEYLDLSNSESPQFSGRAVAALVADPDVLRRSGEVLVAAQLAREYGFEDVDGEKPEPLSRDEA